MDTVDKQLADIFSHNWWALLLRGLVAITFGALALLMPMVSVRFLVLLFGSFVLVDGMLGIWLAIAGRKQYSDWIALFMWGLAGLGVGIMTFAKPGITTMVLLWFMAIWAITTGVLEIVVAIRLRKEIKGEWLLILGGLLSVAFGVLLMTQPGAGALAMIWLIGAYAVVFGLLLLILAFKMRRFIRQLVRSHGAAEPEKSIVDSAD
jgi:uncharacterized membrane protein HdeD (DUF308 family)